ncbi:MAG: TolC family protein, partial [Alistipes sp.]|nr:TolC family protein [Alistipes sp.]
ARAKSELRAKQIKAMKRAVESTELLMEHSSTTYLEVLTAQQSLLSAQLSQIAARFDEIQGVITLYQALGGGRDTEPEPKKK